MKLKQKFRIEFQGTFHTGELYDAKGREVYDLEDAATAAEELYGESWHCVYNGEVAISRNEWLSGIRPPF